MVAINHRHEIVVFPIHKNASTSIKYAMYQLDTGQEFTDLTASRLGTGIHRMYPYRKIEKWEPHYLVYQTIVIIRDPIDRFLSAYDNRVIYHKCLHEQKSSEFLLKNNFNVNPDIEEFILHFDIYAKSSLTVRRHTYTQSSLVGSFFEKIEHRISFEEINKFPTIIRDHCGISVKFPRKEANTSKTPREYLNRKCLDILTDLYADDYEMLKNHYCDR